MGLKKLARLQAPDNDTPEGGTDVVEQETETVDEGVSHDEEEEQGQEALSEEVTVTIGEPAEEDEKQAPDWVRQLRKENREKAKRLKELESELQRVKGGTNPEPLKKPKLEDFDYDSDAFESAMESYYSEKSKRDKEEEKRRQAEEEQQKEWQARQETYTKAKEKYPEEDMKEAEDEVVSALSPARQAMLLDVADDPATLVYALGKNPEVLRKLAAIKSDGQAIKEMVKIEMNIKVNKGGKTPPPPERTISGSGKTAGASMTTLEKLREEAAQSGDYSKYLAEKRRQGK